MSISPLRESPTTIPGPVDPPGPLALLAHDALGLVLGAEVGMRVEVFGLVEHVLAPLAFVEAGDGDRADMVEAAGVDRAGQFDRVLGTLDVGDLLRLGAGGHVVDRRQVEEVVDLAAQLEQVLLGDSETGLGEVAGDRHDARPVGAPAGAQLLEPPTRPGAYQCVDSPVALQESLHEVAADESGGSGDEVVHRCFIHSFQGWRKRRPCRSRCPRWASRSPRGSCSSGTSPRGTSSTRATRSSRCRRTRSMPRCRLRLTALLRSCSSRLTTRFRLELRWRRWSLVRGRTDRPRVLSLQGTHHPLRSLKRPRGRFPLQRHPRTRRLELPTPVLPTGTTGSERLLSPGALLRITALTFARSMGQGPGRR